MGLPFVLAAAAAGCSASAESGEIACQQRLVDIADNLSTSSPPGGVAGLVRAFRTMSGRYAAMTLTGCTEDQRGTVPLLARATADLAASTERAAAAGGIKPDLAASAIFLEFQDRLSGFENRRAVLRRDLAAMRERRRVNGR